jgi:hypothetical protein
MTEQRLRESQPHHTLLLLALIVFALTILALIVGRGPAILALVPAGTDVTAAVWTFTGALCLVALWPLIERRRAALTRRVLAVGLVVVLGLVVLALTLIIAWLQLRGAGPDCADRVDGVGAGAMSGAQG